MWINWLPDPLTLPPGSHISKITFADGFIENILIGNSIITLLTEFKQQAIISPNILIAISVYLQDTVK